MLYLFNSAFRKLYRANVIKTLAVPDFYSNEYRYSMAGGVIQVPPELIGTLNSQPDLDVAIIFIDRFSPDRYTYYPLRLGKFLSSRSETGRLHIQVELNRFVFPRTLGDFNNRLLASLGPLGVAQLTDSNPNETNDGYYALVAEDLFLPEDNYYWDQDGWVFATEALTNSQKFKSPDLEDFVFLKTEITDQYANIVKPSHSRGGSIYDFNKSGRYSLKTTYKYPPQNYNPDKTNKFDIFIGNPLKDKGPKKVSISSRQNNFILALETLNFPEETTGAIDFQFPNDLVDPELSIKIRMVDEWYSAILLALYVIIFVLAGAAIGTDFSKVTTLQMFISTSWIKFIAGLSQAVSLYGMFRLLGKKFL